MRAGIGRLLFFDRLAEGMQTAFVEGMPRRLALHTDGAQGIALNVDVKSPARALCRYHLPAVENVPELSFSRDAIEESSALVFNGEGRTLSECLERIALGQFPDVIVVINFIDDAAQFARVIYDPRLYEDLIIDALEYLFSQCGQKTSVLARVRFQEGGFRELEKSFDLFDEPAAFDWSSKQTFELFYYRLSRAWIYRGYPVTIERIRTWVEQFSSVGLLDEAHQLLMYLQQYGYVTETTIVEGLVKKYFEAEKGDGLRVVAVSIQKPGKSEQKLAYRLRPHVMLRSFAEVLPILRTGTKEKPIFVFCFDDCIGSGESIIEYLFESSYNPYCGELVKYLRDGCAKISVITFHADVKAIGRLEALADAWGSLRILPVRIVDDNHRAFSDTSKIFANAIRRSKFMGFCAEIGERLLPGSALGWNNCQWVIAYDYSIPDNSLPVLFGSSTVEPMWQPLFERVR
jgi:hypothetical protein